jgi:hypothetical protein
MRRSVRAVPDAVQERLIPYASKLPRIGVCSPLRSLRGRSRRRGRGVCRLDRFLVGPDVAQKHMRVKALVSIRAWPSSFCAPLEAAGRARTAASSRVGAYRADERPHDAPKHQATPIGLLTLNQITIGPQQESLGCRYPKVVMVTMTAPRTGDEAGHLHAELGDRHRAAGLFKEQLP